MKRLRVAVMTGGFPDSRHPTNGIFNYRSAKALAERVNVGVITLRAWKPRRRVSSLSSFDGLPVHTLAIPQIPFATALNIMLYARWGWPFVQQLLSETDVIHSVDAAGAGIIAGSWSRRANKPHVVQVTQLMNRDTTPQLWSPQFFEWWKNADAIACNSAALAASVAATWPEAARRCHIVPRGVDLKQFNPDVPAATGLPGGKGVRFLFVGGFPAYQRLPYGANTKGGFVLLEAWKAAEDQLRNAGASLVIGGPGCEDRDFLKLYRSLAHPDLVHIVGLVPSDRVAPLMRASDAVVLPSMHEGMPNVAFEAAACGRAVIGSAIGPIEEVVTDGVTGVLLPPGDVAGWAASLQQLSSSRETLHAMGGAARKRAEERFDCRDYARRMLAVYDFAASQHAYASDGSMQTTTHLSPQRHDPSASTADQ